MSTAHYIVRVGNEGFANKSSSRTPNHWHYLSPQHLWGLPKDMPHVKVRAEFIEKIENPRIATYIWFLCNGHNGPGHFVQAGIGRRHVDNGPVANGPIPIPSEVMARLQQGFDHWFNWRPVTLDGAFLNRLRRIPAPVPTFIPTLRRVTTTHASLPLFQALLHDDAEEQETVAVAPTTPAAAAAAASTAAAVEADLKNLQREDNEPNSQGCVYLIHMKGTAFYKIGMSLDPQLRLRTLQTGNPCTLQLQDSRVVKDMRSAD
ncbi:MAG: hypothetical protein Q9220_004092 [cf. Caloplaca sp. 1 TL-2023]